MVYSGLYVCIFKSKYSNLKVYNLECIILMLISNYTIQGSHKLWKSWKTWKITIKSSMHGKIMEFEKT